MTYAEYWEKIYTTNDTLRHLMQSYWNAYSHVGTWQFWFIAISLILPLIILFFTVDKRRIFELFFFGFVVHMLWSYTLLALSSYNLFTHTYFLTPLLPFGLNVSASALPVGFLLVYQYCTNRGKNFFICALLISAVFAFGFSNLEESLGLLDLQHGMNRIYIFLIDLAIIFTSYFFTKFLKNWKESS